MLWQLKKAVASVSILVRAFYKGCLFLFSRVFPHFSLVIGGQIASGDLDGHLKMDRKQSQNQSFKKLSVLTYYLLGKLPDVFFLDREWDECRCV